MTDTNHGHAPERLETPTALDRSLEMRFHEHNQHIATLAADYILRLQERRSAELEWSECSLGTLRKRTLELGIVIGATMTKKEIIETLTNALHPIVGLRERLSAFGVDMTKYDREGKA